MHRFLRPISLYSPSLPSGMTSALRLLACSWLAAIVRSGQGKEGVLRHPIPFFFGVVRWYRHVYAASGIFNSYLWVQISSVMSPVWTVCSTL
ncbi:hypothetical protein BGW80DRAFT_809996 [Lactifluus volemus]|nr:hypothetical protein BGW80DRAFT_809996 [Lactifluus volemus]